ncbi:hypothetical protein [Roseomonas sp. BN140053]|uniref:hypothetical protein n=1 Tax=Roseomonas sp. BN140053 TaxID=3391898 RepID=UPI0039EBA8A8
MNHNDAAMRIGAAPANAAALRAMQIARFSTRDEILLLTEATQVLQDLGFTVEESTPDAGFLGGSKSRDATEAGQVAAAVALSIAAAFFLVVVAPTWDANQTIRVVLTSRPVPDRGGTEMRASFERSVTNNQGQSRYENLEEPGIYEEFFRLLRSGLSQRGIA